MKAEEGEEGGLKRRREDESGGGGGNRRKRGSKVKHKRDRGVHFSSVSNRNK